MIKTMNTKIADQMMDCLATTGPEGRALKALRRYRHAPTEAAAVEALSCVNGLDENKRAELRQAARL